MSFGSGAIAFRWVGASVAGHPGCPGAHAPIFTCHSDTGRGDLPVTLITLITMRHATLPSQWKHPTPPLPDLCLLS